MARKVSPTVVAGVSVLLVSVALVLSVGAGLGTAANLSGRVLSEGEMARLYGDVPVEPEPQCKKEVICNVNLKTEVTIGNVKYTCLTCKSDTKKRKLCCTTPNPDDGAPCSYSGAIVCDNVPRFYGAANGTPDSCDLYPGCTLKTTADGVCGSAQNDRDADCNKDCP
jgi:hypothetical protein